MMIFFRKNNKGIAMISIMITVAFLAIIATALLSISYSNYRMKVVNQNSKKNFYDTEKSLNIVAASVRSKVKGSTTPEAFLGTELDVVTSGSNQSYNMDKVGNIIKTSYGANVENYAKVSGGRKKITYTLKNPDGSKDYFILSTNDNNNYKVDDKNTDSTIPEKVKKITLKDINIEQFSNVSLNGTGGVVFDGSTGLPQTYDYSNKIKTDLVCMYEEGTATSGGSAGVGDFSVLCDSSISCTGSTSPTMATLLYLYGNAYFANYATPTKVNIQKYDASGNALTGETETCWVTNPGGTALTLNQDNKVSCKGDYVISYGNIILNKNSVLIVDCPNFYCYGNITLNDTSALICTGKIYMPSGYSISKGSNASVFPSGTTAQTIDEYKLINFKKKIGCCDPDATGMDATKAKKNDGIIPQICKQDVKSVNNNNPMTWYESMPNNFKVEGSTTFKNSYGYTCKVKIQDEDGGGFGNINGGARCTLSFLNPNKGSFHVKEGNAVSTLLTKKSQIQFEMNHDVVLTNVGNDAFNYFIKSSITLKGDNDNYKYKLKDMFVDNPDDVISSIIGSLGGGSSSASTPPQTTIGFSGWAKDF